MHTYHSTGAQPRQLPIALHGVTHRPSPLRQLTEHTLKLNMVNGVFRRREMINFLSNHKAEAEDGANFKQAIWTQAAPHMSTLHPNDMFSANWCSSKQGRVHQCLLSQSLTNCYSIASRKVCDHPQAQGTIRYW